MPGSVNPPGGVNLAIAMFALVGAAMSIITFISRYVPRHQYAVFCDLLNDIHSALTVDDWQWPLDQRCRLWQQYRSVSENLEHFQYLISTPVYRSVFHISTAWRLRSLRESASRLKFELNALSQIKRRRNLEKIMKISGSTPSALHSSDASTAENDPAHTQNTGAERLTPCVSSSPRWWRWSKTPQVTALKAADDCECPPV